MGKDHAKTILCYGDSNTWGSNPSDYTRYPRSVRWTGILEDLLGKEYEVVSEGLCGRTLVAVDPSKPHRTGITHLQALYESAYPVDVLIIMLGTNDVKSTYALSAEDIAAHLEQTIVFMQNTKFDSEGTPHIVVVCPPSVVVPESGELDPRLIRGLQLFKVLPGLYRQVAEKYGCDYLNAGDYISSSKIDGTHFDPEAHARLAEVLRDLLVKKQFVLFGTR